MNGKDDDKKDTKPGDEAKCAKKKEDAKKEEGKTATKNLVVFVCKYVAIATGHNSIPNMPSYPGQDQFEGR